MDGRNIGDRVFVEIDGQQLSGVIDQTFTNVALVKLDVPFGETLYARRVWRGIRPVKSRKTGELILEKPE